ncbi:MAG: sigma-70 family RNA polymerase sigma factor [Verrucomicrobia bacterium]|nr:sigma-70 family RNA polymerase sigma factor [Verrucomicrobiota bacterium]
MSDDVTQLLNAIESGDPKAAEELLPLIYGELRKLAAVRMSQAPAGQTLQATALVHEAWLRVNKSGPREWNSRAHFFSAAAEAMRRILVERARQKASQKRGGGFQRVDLDHVDIAQDTDSELLLALDGALVRYAEKDATGAELIKLRFFAGLPNAQVAEILGVSERTAKRTWAYARAWLMNELQKQI